MALTALVSDGYLKNVSEVAIVEISKDRGQFDETYKLVYDYCKKYSSHDKIQDKQSSIIYISDKYAIMDAQSDLNAVYERQAVLYTSNPFFHANALANLIHEKTHNKYIKLRTIKEQEEFTIDYQARQLISIFKLDNYRTTTHRLISPHVIDGVNYFPAEIEIIDIYHQLYTMSEYSNNILNEDRLYKQVIHRREHNMIGGSLDCKELRKEITEHIKISIVKDLINYSKDKHDDNPYVLLGTWAYNWMISGEDICANKDKVQIMSTMNSNEFLKVIRDYVNKILTGNKSVTITMKSQDLYIPKDFRTVRYTYYMTSKTHHGTVDKPFLDLFNCANFEVIPYDNINGIQIASKWVLLRFMFIDVWIVRFIKNIGALDEHTLENKLSLMWKIIDYFRSMSESTIKEQYIGTYINYDVAKKMDAMKQNKFYQAYFPEESMRKHKKYRNL